MPDIWSMGVLTPDQNKTFPLIGRRMQLRDTEEAEPTFYMHKKEGQSDHIDYGFVPRGMIESDVEVTVGGYNDWIGSSHHMPMVVTT